MRALDFGLSYLTFFVTVEIWTRCHGVLDSTSLMSPAYWKIEAQLRVGFADLAAYLVAASLFILRRIADASLAVFAEASFLAFCTTTVWPQ
jgi:hypothetical protein